APPPGGGQEPHAAAEFVVGVVVGAGRFDLADGLGGGHRLGDHGHGAGGGGAEQELGQEPGRDGDAGPFLHPVGGMQGAVGLVGGPVLVDGGRPGTVGGDALPPGGG